MADYRPPSPMKALSSVGSTIFQPVKYVGSVGSTIVGTTYSKTTRGASETASFLTTGQTLSSREKAAATQLQAAVRGKAARVQYEDMVAKESRSFFSCVSSRKPPPKAADDGWLCGCGGRKPKPAKIPKGGMPGLARPPSFPRREYPEEAKEDRM